MPIYAYRCSTCGHAQDVLQKISDDVLTVCPACGAASFVKQVTAAGFQLKGSGWYVTDFRGGNAGAKEAKDGAPEVAKDGAKDGAKETAKAGAAETGSDSAKSAPATAGKTPAAAPATEAAKPAAASPPTAPKAGA